jgi:hypothetical protein
MTTGAAMGELPCTDFASEDHVVAEHAGEPDNVTIVSSEPAALPATEACSRAGGPVDGGLVVTR